ncbi:MAG: hypothetical protein M3463_15400 [Verrucomicrobiota bacterium]|nr:hypothetical protein [Verrucomicrobiota bacterium]
MAQARPRSDPEISLFPFLSILVCLIGALVLLIVILTMVQSAMADGRSFEEVVRAREADKLRRELAAMDKQMRELLGGRDDPAKLKEELKLKQERFVLLRKRLTSSEEEKKKMEQTNAELQKQLENFILQLQAMKAERPALQAAIDKLKAELAARKKNLDAKPTVIVQPAGGGMAADASLFFVEVAGSGIVIHESPDKKTRISTGSIGTDASYDAFLKRVAVTPKSMLIFLLREDGLATYNRAAGWAESRFAIRLGKLPLPGAGEPDLSRFQTR